MENVDYDKILNKIEAAAQEREGELDYSGADSYRQKANALLAWVNGGMKGKIPIDLGEFGVDAILGEKSGIEIPAPLPTAEAEEKKPSSVLRPPDSRPPITNLEEVKPAIAQKEFREEVEESKLENENISFTPEERQIQKSLKEIREYINAGRMRQAVALASVIAERASGSAKEAAEQIWEEARQKRDHAVSLAIQKGDEFFQKGDNEQARRHYEAVLEFNPDNAHAKAMIRKIEGGVESGKIPPQKATELRGGLNDLKNIKRLGLAVYEAEALDAEGRLPRDLQTLLHKARENYDNIRVAQGDETTMMRFGDLAARKEARDRIANRLAQGEVYIYDVTINEDRPSFDMLQEADKLLESQSADTAQYEMDVINGLLPAHPAGAYVRLEAALAKPFHDHHRRLLEKKKEEINSLLEKQKSAETLLAQADEEEKNDPVKAYATALVAHGVFPYLHGIDVKIAQARSKAEAFVSRKMEDIFTQARVLLGGKDSEKVRLLIENAMHLLDGWPSGSEIPETLQSFDALGGILLEFEAQSAVIRKQVEDPNLVGAALKKLEEIRKDERFASLPELRAFISDMDQYRDTEDQLREARAARMAGDWRRVFDLTRNLRESKSAGNLATQVESLYAEAEREVRIEDARSLLDNLEIKKANAIFSQIILTEKDPERKQQLEERLKSDLEIIKTAISNTAILQPVFDRALAFRNGREEERLLALRLFRFVGNMGEKPDPELPDFVITLRTADARQAALDLSRELMDRCWTPIEKAFKGDKRKKIQPDELERLARLARILRDANLVDSADKRAALRWVEVEWTKSLAQSKEKTQDWEGLLEIWESLYKIYSDDEETAKHLEESRYHAQIAGNILQATVPERPRDALLFIRDALKDEKYRPFYSLLSQRREQIFRQAQEDLLRQGREALSAGSVDGKINAFVALLDLRDLEEIVGIPELRRRSAGEMKRLNPNDFKNAAESVFQHSTAFSPAQQPMEASIRLTREITSRLEMFEKVAPLFSSRWNELEERLERRRVELLLLNHKMEEANRVLREARDPELWNDALRRGSFDALRMKRDAMASQGIPNFASIPDIREFDKKMREWQEAYDFLKNRADEMRKAFDVDEDYKKVVDIARRLTSRPSDWQAVTHADYEQILAQVDFYLFRVINIYGGKSLAGRAEIEFAARERETQYENWLRWSNLWKQSMNDAEHAMQAVNQYAVSPDKKIAFQIRDWEIFQRKAQAAQEILRKPPEDPENILSKKTSLLYEASLAALADVEEWLRRAAIAIEKLNAEPKFPSAEEFRDAANKNDLPGLEKLLARAERAGALTSEEEKRLNTYRRTYEILKQESQKKPFWRLR